MHTSTTSTVPLEPWTPEQLQEATQGEWLHGNIPQGAIKRILTDSRHAEVGDIFLALKGERFDAHDFVAQVATQGCQIAIVEHPIDVDIAQLVVPDTAANGPASLTLGKFFSLMVALHTHIFMLNFVDFAVGE